MVLRQVVELDTTAGPAARPLCPVELEHAMNAAVAADHVLHSLILLDRRLGEQVLEPEKLFDLLARAVREVFGAELLVKRRRPVALLLLEPVQRLHVAVRIRHPCQLPCLVHRFFLDARIKGDGLADEPLVDEHAAVVDGLVEAPETAFSLVWERPLDALADGALGFDVLCVVGLEELPLLRIVERIVARASTVRFRRLARLAEILDEPLARCKFLLVLWNAERLADGTEAAWQAERVALHHRAEPLRGFHESRLGWQLALAAVHPHPLVEHVHLERGIVCRLQSSFVPKADHDVVRQCLASREVYDVNRLVIPRIGEQQDFGVLRVAVETCLSDVHRAIGFEVDGEDPHCTSPA